MPIILSAKKKLRQSQKHQTRNIKVKSAFKKALKKARLEPTKKNIQLAYSAIDKAAKKHIIHKNTAARLKSRLTKVNPSTTLRSDSGLIQSEVEWVKNQKSKLKLTI